MSVQVNTTLDPQESQKFMSDSLWPPELQYTRDLCPSLSPRVCLNSCPVCLWCHPTISSSVPFSSCPQSFPASESFPMIWLFTSGGQSIGTSASTSVLLMSIQGWFPSVLIGLISLLSMGLSRVFSSTAIKRIGWDKETTQPLALDSILQLRNLPYSFLIH